MAINLSKDRLASLDVFRGITMFLLVAEGTRLYSSLEHLVNPESFWGKIVAQFTHHPWNGLRFWDLVQPYFMFIVGVAMAFSLTKRWSQGASWMDTFKHILFRCGLLLLFGVMLHCGYHQKLVWELWNVLSQLSFTILVAFLIFNLPLRTQLIISFVLLLITELVYRFFPVNGFNQPFVPDQNFGSWMDMVLMGKLSGGHWVAINCVPTAAHTIWGVLAAKILMKDKSESYKLKILVLAGLIGVIIGYGMDWTGLTPIVKRICTSSFVIVSGGWCLLTLAFFYWLVDIMGFQRWIKFFTIVGMNSIFIYLFSETVGHQWFNNFVGIFTNGFFSMAGITEPLIAVLTALVVLLLEWGLCYWLYKQKILIKI